MRLFFNIATIIFCIFLVIGIIVVAIPNNYFNPGSNTWVVKKGIGQFFLLFAVIVPLLVISGLIASGLGIYLFPIFRMWFIIAFIIFFICFSAYFKFIWA
jgi:hypothetical protein